MLESVRLEFLKEFSFFSKGVLLSRHSWTVHLQSEEKRGKSRQLVSTFLALRKEKNVAQQYYP